MILLESHFALVFPDKLKQIGNAVVLFHLIVNQQNIAARAETIHLVHAVALVFPVVLEQILWPLVQILIIAVGKAAFVLDSSIVQL